MDWLQFLLNLVATGILLYVFQKIIDERSAKRLEKFKAELQSVAFENATKFSKLHEMRIQVIAELYRKLMDILGQLFDLKSDFRSTSQSTNQETINRFQSLDKMMDDFDAYIYENKLYLPLDLFSKLQKFISRSLITEFEFQDSFDNNNRIEVDLETYITRHRKHLLEASSILAEELLPLRNEIEVEFRKLLGS